MGLHQAHVVAEAVRLAEREVADVDIVTEGSHTTHVEHERVLQVNERLAVLVCCHGGDNDTATNAELVAAISIFHHHGRRDVRWWLFAHRPDSIRLNAFFAVVLVLIPDTILVRGDAQDNEVQSVRFLANLLATYDEADTVALQADAVKATAEGVHRRSKVSQQDITHLCGQRRHQVLCKVRQGCECVSSHNGPLTL